MLTVILHFVFQGIAALVYAGLAFALAVVLFTAIDSIVAAFFIFIGTLPVGVPCAFATWGVLEPNVLTIVMLIGYSIGSLLSIVMYEEAEKKRAYEIELLSPTRGKTWR